MCQFIFKQSGEFPELRSNKELSNVKRGLKPSELLHMETIRQRFENIVGIELMYYLLYYN
jgi:hypothetical protein